MNDKKLKELCERIWENETYANAIEILMEYRTTPIKKLYEKLRQEFTFYEESVYIDLESIRELYKIADKKWEDGDEIIFEITLEYFGHDDEIRIGFYYPDLDNQDIKIKYICEEFMKKIRKKLNKKTTNIAVIRKKNISDFDNEKIKELVEEINEYDKILSDIIKNQIES